MTKAKDGIETDIDCGGTGNGCPRCSLGKSCTVADSALIEAYFGAVSSRRLARLALMKIMSDFREAMWGVVQQAISSIEFDFSGYAAEHFDRLSSNATSPKYRADLDAASAHETGVASSIS